MSTRRVKYDDFDRTTGYRERNSGKRKKKHGFAIFMGIYVVAALIATFVFWRWFNGYLMGYEQSMPKHAMDDVMEAFDNGMGIGSVLNKASLSTEYSYVDFDTYAAYLHSVIDGKKITMQESALSTGEIPRYTLLADGVPFTDVTLRSLGKNKYGMDVWDYSHFFPDAYCINEETYRITAPTGSIVYANGNALTESDYAKDDNGAPLIDKIDTLRNVEQYLDSVPTYTTYEIRRAFGSPVISVRSSDGSELSVSQDGKNYTAKIPLDDALVAELQPKVEEYIIPAYGLHFIGVNGSAIFDYLLPGSTYREDLSTATTYFYPTSKISTRTFENIRAYDFATYTDDCISCEVYFDLNVTFNTEAYKPKNEGADATWVFIKQDGNWYLADVPRQRSADQAKEAWAAEGTN